MQTEFYCYNCDTDDNKLHIIPFDTKYKAFCQTCGRDLTTYWNFTQSELREMLKENEK